MKHLIFCTLLLVTTTLFAQNGGQYPENNSVKLEFAGLNQTRVYNKQSCTAIIRVSYNNTTQDLSIPGNSNTLISTPAPGKITAKATTNCGNADFGLVELDITSQLLPLQFVSLKVVSVGDNKVKVYFEVEQVSDVNKFIVQASVDGNTWYDIMVILPDNIQPNRLYETPAIQLSTKNK